MKHNILLLYVANHFPFYETQPYYTIWNTTYIHSMKHNKFSFSETQYIPMVWNTKYFHGINISTALYKTQHISIVWNTTHFHFMKQNTFPMNKTQHFTISYLHCMIWNKHICLGLFCESDSDLSHISHCKSNDKVKHDWKWKLPSTLQ